MTDTTYYASPETDTKTAAKKVYEIIRNQQMRLYSDRGIANVWNRNLEIYFKNATCDVLDFVGDAGELVSMSVPQARSLTRQTIAIICKQKLNFKALSRASDYSSMANGKIAEALTNQLVKSQKLDAKKLLISEHAYVVGQGFWHLEWDAEAGENVSNPTPTIQSQQNTQVPQLNQVQPTIQPTADPTLLSGNPEQLPPTTQSAFPQKTGDVKISVLTPQYVFYDWNVASWEDLSCVTVAERVNRYDLVSLHPELEKEILQLPKFNRKMNNSVSGNMFGTPSDNINDLVLIYKYYHKPTPACPFGRMMILASDTCIFYDGSNPYECLPVIPVMPERMPDYLLGYPQFSNLAPMQEMLDHNFSVIASNQSAFGVQTVLNPRGSNIDITNIEGLQWVDYTPQTIDGGGKPEALQLTKTAPELIDMIPQYKNQMAEIANISGALRGTPPAGITAGNALATLTANSIEFLTSFSQTLYSSIEEMMTLSVKYYRMFGAETQIVAMADGKTTYAQEFKNSDLASFERVTLDITNPTMATYGGRQNDVEQLLAAGLIQDIGTYFRVKDGAPVSTTYETVVDESNLIQKENDDLLEGQECPVLFTDNHQMHIQHHKALLNNPEIRRNGQMVNLILTHIEQHNQMMMQQMMPPPMPGQPQQGSPQATGGPAPTQPPQGPAPAQPAKPGATF